VPRGLVGVSEPISHGVDAGIAACVERLQRMREGPKAPPHTFAMTDHDRGVIDDVIFVGASCAGQP